VLGEVGLAFAVADAHPSARAAAHHVTRLGGGCGAVREVCDRLLAARPARRGAEH
jgi:3-deoxy-D-manno-octulosonate 8-phosphate phosphatase (KDO 8-P phosphatase)